MREDVAEQNDLHKLVRIGQRRIACANQAQQRIKQPRAHNRVTDAKHEIQKDGVAKDLRGLVVTLLPQTDRDQRTATTTHQRAQCRAHIHHRQGQRQPGNRHGPHAMTDEDAIDDVVNRCRGGGNHSRNRVVRQQLKDIATAQLPQSLLLRFIDLCCLLLKLFAQAIPLKSARARHFQTGTQARWLFTSVPVHSI